MNRAKTQELLEMINLTELAAKEVKTILEQQTEAATKNDALDRTHHRVRLRKRGAHRHSGQSAGNPSCCGSRPRGVLEPDLW